MKMAKWTIEYEPHSDKTYECPSCPECDTPLFSVDTDGEGYCEYCEEVVSLTESQANWIKTHYEEKTKEVPCFKCGEPSVIVYSKNPVSGEWYAAFINCDSCGTSFIV